MSKPLSILLTEKAKEGIREFAETLQSFLEENPDQLHQVLYHVFHSTQNLELRLLQSVNLLAGQPLELVAGGIKTSLAGAHLSTAPQAEVNAALNQLLQKSDFHEALAAAWHNHAVWNWLSAAKIQILRPCFLKNNILNDIAYRSSLPSPWSLENWGWLAEHPELTQAQAINTASQARHYTAVALIAGLHPESVTTLNTTQRKRFPGIDRIRTWLEGKDTDEGSTFQLWTRWPNVQHQWRDWPFHPLGIQKERVITHAAATTQPWGQPDKPITHTFPGGFSLLANDCCIKSKDAVVALKISDRAAVVILHLLTPLQKGYLKGLLTGAQILPIESACCITDLTEENHDERATRRKFLNQLVQQNLCTYSTRGVEFTDDETRHQLLAELNPEDLDQTSRFIISAWGKTKEIAFRMTIHGNGAPRQEFKNVQRLVPGYQLDPDTFAKLL